jgi:hypothetical protein
MRIRVTRFLATSGIFTLCLGAQTWLASAEAAGVQVGFSIENPADGPFPSNLFTVPDPSHNTGLRVNLPKPDCTVYVSDCQDIDVINTLDGFNLQPRLSIPFTGSIDVNTITSETVFLVRLGSTLSGGNPAGQIVGINQVVWNPDLNTLHVESDELLDQHTRYALIVTRGVRDAEGHRLRPGAFVKFRHQLSKVPDLRGYNKALRDALRVTKETGVRRDSVVAVSVFTTQSTTAILEKIRDRIKADTPAHADFLLGPGGTRTIFPLNNISSILFNRQTGTAPTFTPTSFPVLLAALRSIPNVVGSIAFGKYVSLDYEAAGQFIPPVGTASGVPAVQSENEVYFNLFLPSGIPPLDGWPVAIFGHGLTNSKENTVFFLAADMAARGLATIAINAVGHGNGSLGTLTVNQVSGGPVTFPAGGRGIDQNDDSIIAVDEGFYAAPPRDIINNRDGQRQTVVDLMQLVREIEVGMDVDGDTLPDLDPSRIYYQGFSQGGMYGALFLAVEPHISTGVLNVPGGPNLENFRLAPALRPSLGIALSLRIPSLINVGGIVFNENMPLRDQLPVINSVAGAMALQQFFEWSEWVTGAGNPVAYAPHLRKAPLVGVPFKEIILQFAKGDTFVSNPATTAMIRAGDLAEQTTYYRHDLAFASRGDQSGVPVPKGPHPFLFFNALLPTPTPTIFFPAVADVGAGARQQIAEFFASDGVNVIDPDGAGPLFEVPIEGPLPEELNFIP